MAIWLEQFQIDRWRRAEGATKGEGVDAGPVALIADTAHGPRIDAVNQAAALAGAGKGMMLADARSLCPHLAVAPSDPAGDLACLEKLSLWIRRWGPWSAIDPPDGLILDLTGTAHLFGGEGKLLADALDQFDRLGFAARLAIAPTAGASWGLAHYGAQGTILWPDDDASAHLADLPVAALRLDEDIVQVLRRLGLKRLGQLRHIARDQLKRRFRNSHSPAANPLLRMDQILGRIPEPLLPVVAVDVPLVQRRLLEPIRHRPLLDRVVEDLASDMARLLEGKAQGARRLEIGLWRVDGEVVMRDLEMSDASRDPAHICYLFAAKLDGVDAGFGIELVRMRATWAQPLALGQEDFEAAAERHGTSLAACIDRLMARLGPQAVRRPVSHASHIPERAQRWLPPLDAPPVRQAMDRQGFRPLKLLDRPEEIKVVYAAPDGPPYQFRWRGNLHEVLRVEGPERIGPEWWHEKSTTRLRDYYRIEDKAGRRYWIYRLGLAGDGRGGLPEWYLHGLCG